MCEEVEVEADAEEGVSERIKEVQVERCMGIGNLKGRSRRASRRWRKGGEGT